MILCDVDDCLNIRGGECQKLCIITKKGACENYIRNMDYLRDKWRWVQGKESVPPHQLPPWLDRIKKGELNNKEMKE